MIKEVLANFQFTFPWPTKAENPWRGMEVTLCLKGPLPSRCRTGSELSSLRSTGTQFYQNWCKVKYARLNEICWAIWTTNVHVLLPEGPDV